MICKHYEHDCNKCVPLGWFQEEYMGTVIVYDLYHCMEFDTYPTIVARYGQDGDYSSGMPFGKHNNIPALAEAYKRSVERGLNVHCGCARCGY